MRLSALAKDVRWTIVGYMVLEGADAVRQTLPGTAASLEDTATPTTGVWSRPDPTSSRRHLRAL